MRKPATSGMKRWHVLELALLEGHGVLGSSGLALDVAILSTTCAVKSRSFTVAGSLSNTLIVGLDTIVPIDAGLLLERFTPHAYGGVMVRLAGGEDVVSGLFACAGKVQVGGVSWRVGGVRDALIGLIKLI
jgi:hypothetical protein